MLRKASFSGPDSMTPPGETNITTPPALLVVKQQEEEEEEDAVRLWKW